MYTLPFTGMYTTLTGKREFHVIIVQGNAHRVCLSQRYPLTSK